MLKAFKWTRRVIKSVNNLEQLPAAMRLANFFDKKFCSGADFEVGANKFLEILWDEINLKSEALAV